MNASQALERARAVMRRQHKSPATELTYLHWLRHYMIALGGLPKTLSSEQKLESFLTELALRKNVSAATQNQAFNAILFFYKDVLGQPLQAVEALRATRPERLRHAPTVGETRAVLAAVPAVGGYPTPLVARLLYGCGLRVSEPLNLRIKDVSFENGRLFIMGGKGRKDRVVALPCSVTEGLRGQLDFARAVWQRDGEAKIPLELPHQLGVKYPGYRFAWEWAWVFPAHWPVQNPRTGERVRYRMHEANVQRALREAGRKTGVRILPHELRHAYATHSLERGVNIKALQEAMGHEQIDTTLGYCHAEALSVCSPLDTEPGRCR